MPDMLVRLYALPDPAPLRERVQQAGVRIRRPERYERQLVVEWVRRRFGDGWADECDGAFAALPARALVAIRHGALVGFACHDCTRPNFFGPAGVAEDARGLGIGRALLLEALLAMRDAGYAYAIVGGVGPAGFYERAVGATMIEDSTPGIYDFSLVERARRPR